MNSVILNALTKRLFRRNLLFAEKRYSSNISLELFKIYNFTRLYYYRYFQSNKDQHQNIFKKTSFHVLDAITVEKQLARPNLSLVCFPIHALAHNEFDNCCKNVFPTLALNASHKINDENLLKYKIGCRPLIHSKGNSLLKTV